MPEDKDFCTENLENSTDGMDFRTIGMDYCTFFLKIQKKRLSLP
jgi:hypothetical protein